MKISIERGTLLKAVAQAQSVVERRNTIPILANVLIEAEGESVSFRATDLDIEVVDRVSAHVERAGATTVSAVMLHEIVRKLPDGGLVQLIDDGVSGRLNVQCGRSSFALATLPREDFPVMASSEYASNFAAPAGVLRRLFDKSKFAISTEETRYYLNGVNFEFTPDVIVMTATDERRAIVLHQPYAAGETPTAPVASVIVPRELVAKLKVKIKSIETCVMTLTPSADGSPRRVTFEYCGEQISALAIGGVPFPAYRRIIPQTLSGKLAQFDPIYLADFAKARAELKGSKANKNGSDTPIVRYNGGDPALVDFAYDTGFQAIGVLMPVRDRTTPAPYAWAYAEPRAWPDAEPDAATL